MCVVGNDQSLANRTVRIAAPDGTIRAVPRAIDQLSRRYFDVSFAGDPVQCDDSDGSCAAVRRGYAFAQRRVTADGHNFDQSQANQYRYVVDVVRRVCSVAR